jgi:hypothetical protein
MRIAFLNILLFALVLGTSCKKKETTTKSTNPPPNSSLNQFTLKKDGVLYTPNTINASVDEDGIGIETYMNNTQVNNNSYGLFVRKSITPGTYILEDGESDDFGILHSQDANTYFGWSNGTLTVLSNDTVTGVLHCTFGVLLYNDDCEGSCPQITDGEMTIYY